MNIKKYFHRAGGLQGKGELCIVDLDDEGQDLEDLSWQKRLDLSAIACEDFRGKRHYKPGDFRLLNVSKDPKIKRPGIGFAPPTWEGAGIEGAESRGYVDFDVNG